VLRRLLRLLRAADLDARHAALHRWSEAGAGEAVAVLGRAEPAAARRQVRRLARLARALAALARPRAEGRVVDVLHRHARVVQDEVVALRVLTQLARLEAEVLPARVAVLLGHL